MGVGPTPLPRNIGGLPLLPPDSQEPGRKALWDTFGNLVTTLCKASRARVVALVTDRYQYRPHLVWKYKFLYNKPLHHRLEEGNCSLYTWLTSVANLSSLSAQPATRQQSIDQHATFTQLSDTQSGRLRRLRDHGGNHSPCMRSKYALGIPAPSGSQLLTSLWQFTAITPPTPLIKPTGRKKVFRSSIQSKQAKLV